jgi:sortase A
MRLCVVTKYLRRGEYLLLFVAGLCAAYCALTAFDASRAMRSSRNFHIGEYAQAMPVRSAGLRVEAKSEAKSTKATDVIGRLEISEISLSAPIFSDDDSNSLLKGVGHIAGTAKPGGLGTLGLAGHRDTYFRSLRNIKKNMTIRVANQEGIYRYIVDSTEIVKPENVEVLDIASRPALTLVTCYPFYFVGAAPLRFIVHAHLLSASPDAIR